MEPGGISNRLQIGQAHEQAGDRTSDHTEEHRQRLDETGEVLVHTKNEKQGEQGQCQIFRIAEVGSVLVGTVRIEAVKRTKRSGTAVIDTDRHQ